MKKLFLFLVMLMAGLTASAYEYPYLTFQRTDGSEQSVAVESLTLTMADGKLIAVNGNGTAIWARLHTPIVQKSLK